MLHSAAVLDDRVEDVERLHENYTDKMAVEANAAQVATDKMTVEANAA